MHTSLLILAAPILWAACYGACVARALYRGDFHTLHYIERRQAPEDTP